MNKNKIYILVILLTLGLLVFLEAQQKEPVNWYPSYASADKIPLGTFVLYNELEKNFLTQPVAIPPYEFLLSEPTKGSYLFINNQLVFDDAELEKLLEWVKQGNRIFLAAESFGENLLDTLNLEMRVQAPETGISSKPMFNLTNPDFQTEEAYLYDQETYHYTFSEIDSLQHTVLGVSQLYNGSLSITDPRTNFLQVPFGEGLILLHSTPQVFTNFFILENGNSSYVERVLGYLSPQTQLYWDAYYKAGKTFYTSPLFILLNTRSLKWAYYFFLIGSLLFVIFEGKRKQRSIPVLVPPQNQSFAFTRTISDMYLERKDFTAMGQKKIMQFLQYIRNQFGLSPTKTDDNFMVVLSSKSEVPKEEIKTLFEDIARLQRSVVISKEELKNLHHKIESFKKLNNGK